jgi:GT2 family glycosyltransferase
MYSKQEITMSKVAVVVPTLTNKAGGYEALQSIRCAFDIWWQPIIVDNWRENRVLSNAWNKGIEEGFLLGADYALVINDDVLFSPWTLTGLVRAFQSNLTPPNVGMVTAVNLRGQMENPTDIFNIEIPSYETHEFGLNPDFSCFMLDKKTYEKVGTFDENFNPAYFEDNDYHYRMQLLDIQAISTQWAPFYHYGSQTQNNDPNHPVVPSDAFIRNRWYYQNKWGGEPGQEVFKRPYNDDSMPVNKWKF